MNKHIFFSKFSTLRLSLVLLSSNLKDSLDLVTKIAMHFNHLLTDNIDEKTEVQMTLIST